MAGRKKGGSKRTKGGKYKSPNLKNIYTTKGGSQNQTDKFKKQSGEYKHGPIVSIDPKGFGEEQPKSEHHEPNDHVSNPLEENKSEAIPFPTSTSYLTDEELIALCSSSSETEVADIWADRITKLPNQFWGAKVLARLRFLQGIDLNQKSYEQFLNSDLISNLPEDQQLNSSELTELSATKQLIVDEEVPLADAEKHRALRAQVVREGQARFKQALIETYGLACMITGETVAEIVEAAHIRPYINEKSNHISNGLLLRVDIHRLFDADLWAVNPETLQLSISQKLIGSTYEVFEGKTLKIKQSRIRIQYLEERWERFTKQT
jgi:hypothetical protein